MSSNCPECSAPIELSTGVLAGEIILCPDCQSQLEVISREPVVLALAPEIEEDWGE